MVTGSDDANDSDPQLSAACALWQSGRNTGSSPLRAAARILASTPHYFEADSFATSRTPRARTQSFRSMRPC